MSAAADIDPVIHAPVRLQICAILSALTEAEFAAVREQVDVSDSVLSKHVKQLEDAGYVAVRKAAVAGRQRTWLGLTGKGRKAFARYLAQLNRLTAAAKLAAE